MSKRVYGPGLGLLAVVATAGCRDEVAGPEPAAIEAAAAASPGNVAAMEAIVATFDAAWTAGDPVTYAAQYAGAEWVGPNGAIQTDPAVITAIYTGIINFALPGTVRQSTIRSLTFLTGTIAVLDIDARVTGFAAPPPGVMPWEPGTLRALEKNILVKRDGEWRIVKHQQTFVAPGVPAINPDP
jgi:hypothetical protein